MTPKIPLLRPYFDSEELEGLKKVLDSGWVAQGPKVKEFEDKIAEYLGVKNAIAVTNCTSALHLALLSIGVKEGDDVLVASIIYETYLSLVWHLHGIEKKVMNFISRNLLSLDITTK